MDANKPEEPPPFRWNRQAVAMVAIMGLMLVVPIAGVVYFLVGRTAPAGTVTTQPLAASLERAADAQLGGERVKLDVESELTLTLPTDQIAARLARIAELARTAGGSALEMSGDGGARRLVISVPAARRGLLIRAISGEKIDFSAVPAGGDAAILDVTLRTP